MKCIGKKTFILAWVLALALVFGGCGQEIVLKQRYDVLASIEEFGLQSTKRETEVSLFATNLCVGGTTNTTDEAVTEGISQAAGLFNLKDKNIEYAKNIHEKLYPASTTKIMTAYVALKNASLTDTTKVSANVLNLEVGSTMCEIAPGDTVSLEQLLYGLILCSGNDAAVAIAEMISGSTEAFAELMNQEAASLGATQSHFANPHGLHDEGHYTTLYDLYLIFQAAVGQEQFLKVLGTTEYVAQYQDSTGAPVTKTWATTNKYLKGEELAPENVTVIGGKTGTTNAAGYCLALYSQNAAAEPFISIVLKADSRDNLYYQMTELLKKSSN